MYHALRENHRLSRLTNAPRKRGMGIETAKKMRTKRIKNQNKRKRSSGHKELRNKKRKREGGGARHCFAAGGGSHPVIGWNRKKSAERNSNGVSPCRGMKVHILKWLIPSEGVGKGKKTTGGKRN